MISLKHPKALSSTLPVSIPAFAPIADSSSRESASHHASPADRTIATSLPGSQHPQMCLTRPPGGSAVRDLCWLGGARGRTTCLLDRAARDATRAPPSILFGSCLVPPSLRRTWSNSSLSPVLHLLPATCHDLLCSSAMPLPLRVELSRSDGARYDVLLSDRPLSSGAL